MKKRNKFEVETHTTTEEVQKPKKKKFSEMEKEEKVKIAIKSTILFSVFLGFLIFFFIMAFFPQYVTHPNMSSELNIAEAYNTDTTSQCFATAQSDTSDEVEFYNEQLMPKNGLGTSRSDEEFWYDLDNEFRSINNGFVEVFIQPTSYDLWLGMYIKNQFTELKSNQTYKFLFEWDCDDSGVIFWFSKSFNNHSAIFPDFFYKTTTSNGQYIFEYTTKQNFDESFFLRSVIDNSNDCISVGDKFRLSIFEEDNPRTTYTPNLNYLVEQEREEEFNELLNLRNDINFDNVKQTDKVFHKTSTDDKINFKRIYSLSQSVDFSNPKEMKANNFYKLDHDYLSDNGVDVDSHYDYFYPLVKSAYSFDTNFFDTECLGFGFIFGTWTQMASGGDTSYNGNYLGVKLVYLDVLEGTPIGEPTQFVYQEYAYKEFQSTAGFSYFDDIDLYLDWTDDFKIAEVIKFNSHNGYISEDAMLNRVVNVPELYNYFSSDIFVGGKTASKHYSDGYNAGVTVGTEIGASLENTIFAVINAPIDALKTMFNFEFFGINISGLIMFLISVVLVFIFIKKVI